MNELDQKLLEGLTTLSDTHLDRLQAHLAAGLPMQIDFGWTEVGVPSCFGCLVGVSMSEEEYDSLPGVGGDSPVRARLPFTSSRSGSGSTNGR